MSTQKNGRTLFKGGTVVTMDSTIPNLATGDVLVHGDRIAAVGANLQVDDTKVIDATGSIVMPGLIDAHHHMWLGVMRRMMPDIDDLFAYIGVVAETLGAQYRPLDMYLSTKLPRSLRSTPASPPSSTPAIPRAAPGTPTPRSMLSTTPASARCTWSAPRWTRRRRRRTC